MPDMTPVANTVNAPNPQGTLDSFSKLLGIQQQQQALQTGRYTQQTAQAEASQAQQKNAELQALARFTQNAMKDPSYQLSDGSPNVGKYQQAAMAVAPTYGQPVIGQATSNFKEAVGTRQAMQNLSGEQNSTIANFLKGLASNKDSTPSDLMDGMEQLRSNNKDPGFNRALDNMLLSFDRKDVAGSAARSASALSGMMQNTPSTMDTGGAFQPGVTNSFTGAFNPAGAAVPKTLAPQVYTPPGGGPSSVVGGAYGTGKGTAPAQAPGGGPQPAAADWQRFGEYNNALDSRVQIASDLLPRLKLTETAADSIRTGAGTETRASIAKALQASGAPQGLVDAVAGGNLAAVQEAEKMMFQTTMSGLKQAMQGDPSRVAEFQAAEKVFPNVDTDPRARQQILGFMSDQGQRDYAEQQALNKARKDGTFNPVTWQGDYQQRLRAGQVPGVPSGQVPKPVGGGERTAVRSGIVKSGPNKGKTVTEYSDGTREYK